MHTHIHVHYRPGSIQTHEIVQQFSRFLSPLWQFYPSPSSKGNSLTLQQYLDNQALLLHGYELQDLKYTPKVHDCKSIQLVQASCKCEMSE